MEAIRLNTGIDLDFEYVAFYQHQTDTTIIVPKYCDVDLILKAHRRLTAYGKEHGLRFNLMVRLSYDRVLKKVLEGTRQRVFL